MLFLQRAYSLQWLVDQECFDVPSLSCMEDCDLIRLLTRMEKARECIADGVSLEDAGLVRTIPSGEPLVKASIQESRSAIRQAEIAAMSTIRTPTPQRGPVGPSKVLTDEQPPF